MCVRLSDSTLLSSTLREATEILAGFSPGRLEKMAPIVDSLREIKMRVSIFSDTHTCYIIICIVYLHDIELIRPTYSIVSKSMRLISQYWRMQNNCTTSDRLERFVFQRCRLLLVVNVKKKVHSVQICDIVRL
jgi:hypothetical protein